jgi:glycosyltransferase involved in cell wall biosynthesis
MAYAADEGTVSVLLPTYNRAKYIAESLDSVLAQTYRPFEIIVIDDGSSDETAAVCARYGANVSYVKVKKNRGKTAAINHGLTLARGEFIWIMDDDDIAPPEALATLVRPLISDDDVGFSFGTLQKFRTDRQGKHRFESSQWADLTAPRSLFVRLMEDCFITGQPCVLFRRRLLAELAPFDERILSSVDYNILLRLSRHHAGVDVKAVVLWQRQHEGSRGPAAGRHSASSRTAKWREFDKRLILDLFPTLYLGEFLGIREAAGGLDKIQVRKANFQKAVIAARKELWSDAIHYLDIGFKTWPDEPLSVEGGTILSRMFGSRYGIDVFLDDLDLQKIMAKTFQQNSVGRSAAVAACARLPFWIKYELRRVRPLKALRVFQAMSRVVGWRQALKLTLDAARRKLGAATLASSAGAKKPKAA